EDRPRTGGNGGGLGRGRRHLQARRQVVPLERAENAADAGVDDLDAIDDECLARVARQVQLVEEPRLPGDRQRNRRRGDSQVERLPYGGGRGSVRRRRRGGRCAAGADGNAQQDVDSNGRNAATIAPLSCWRHTRSPGFMWTPAV